MLTPIHHAGLDLGQRNDHTALAIIEKYVHYRTEEFHLRHIERAPLGTPYPLVVDRIREIVSDPYIAFRCTLAVDATGVGAPIVQMLQFGGIGCEVTPVIITAGEQESQRNGNHNVPKRDLIAGLQVSLENGQLRIARDMKETAALIRELMDIKAKQNQKGRIRLGADGFGEHDDLVIALALALWRAKRVTRMNSFGTMRLPGISG